MSLLPPKLRVSDYVTVQVDDEPWRFRVLRASETNARLVMWGRIQDRVRPAIENVDKADPNSITLLALAVAGALEDEDALPALQADLAADLVAVPNGTGVLSRDVLEAELGRPLDGDYLDTCGWNPMLVWTIWGAVLMAQTLGERAKKKSNERS